MAEPVSPITGPMPQFPPIDPVTEALMRRKQMPTKHRNLQRGFAMTPQERYQDEMDNLRPENIANLLQEISNAKHPKVRAMLMQELERLKGVAQNFLGPNGLPRLGMPPELEPIPTAPLPPPVRRTM